jgi:radical SAM protein with 4Fe4S-binding SPASM domain
MRNSLLDKAIQRGIRLVTQRPKGWWRLLVNQAAAMARCTYVPSLPVHVTIEPTNLCDQRCPICETGDGSLGRKRGSMPLDQFQHLIDLIAPHAHTLMFYFMGEPFLHKDAYAMIRHAKARGLFVTACTDGNLVDGQALVASGIDEVFFQLGGTTQAAHQIYRVRGKLDRALGNLADAVAERRRLGATLPRLVMGLIVMRHNEHQVEEFHRLAREIGADGSELVLPCVRDKVQADRFMPKDETYWMYDKTLFDTQGILRPKMDLGNSCWWIWHSTVITWDGMVLPCCRDPHGHHAMGNVFREPLGRIWNNAAYRAFRRKILTAQGSVEICRLCSGFGVPDLIRETGAPAPSVRTDGNTADGVRLAPSPTPQPDAPPAALRVGTPPDLGVPLPTPTYPPRDHAG